jgi:hypothetical protein
MSWRTGNKLFVVIRAAIQPNITDREERIEFAAKLLHLFC